MSIKVSDIKTGIKIVSGLPGSGKSYSAVAELIDMIVRDRRVVYTNLPLKMPALRKYLSIKGRDPIYTRYIRETSGDHAKRAIARMASYLAWRQRRKREGFPYTVDAFTYQHGPNITQGLDANWYPFTSVIILDEAQHDWPASEQRTEDPSLLAYTSMHRHCFHLWWVLTQDPTRLSITWRKMATSFIEAYDMRQMPLIGMKIPIHFMGYLEYPAIGVDDGKVRKAKPIAKVVRCPTFNRGVIFRLYHSHTHAGSVRRLRRMMIETRSEVEARPVLLDAAVPSSAPGVSRMIRFFFRLLRRPWFWVIALLLGLLLFVGRSAPLDDPAPSAPRLAGAPMPTTSSPTNAAVPGDDVSLLSLMTPDYVLINDRPYRVGDARMGAVLVSIDVATASTTWRDKSIEYVWRLGGHRSPRRVLSESGGAQ